MTNIIALLAETGGEGGPDVFLYFGIGAMVAMLVLGGAVTFLAGARRDAIRKKLMRYGLAMFFLGTFLSVSPTH